MFVCIDNDLEVLEEAGLILIRQLAAQLPLKIPGT
jgi:hypothetical protein